MQPDFDSRGVTRPLSAFLRLAMLGSCALTVSALVATRWRRCHADVRPMNTYTSYSKEFCHRNMRREKLAKTHKRIETVCVCCRRQ